MRRPAARALLTSALLLCAPPAVAQIAPGPGVNPRAVWASPPETFTSRVVASGFEDPWEVTWGPDGYLWITERVGKRVVRVNPADGSRKVALAIDEVHQELAQDGLLGLALHPQLLRGANYVYVMYTYDADPGPTTERRAKIRRYTYDATSELLGEPVDVLTNLPHGPDHGASRIVFGPDGKLYASRGDHGSNFLAYYCVPIRAQELPSAADIQARNWRGYEGKILRVDLDGSIPGDNPVLGGVRSHVFSYGHRNPQGMAFGPDGRLYASEHGQDTDDEVNRVEAGRNYGWPLIAGNKDDQYYTYANWSASTPTPCASLEYGRNVPSTVPRMKESDVSLGDFTPPLETFFTVPSTHEYAGARQRDGGARRARRLHLAGDSRVEPIDSRRRNDERDDLPHPARRRNRAAADVLQGARPLSRSRDCAGRAAHLRRHGRSRARVDGRRRVDGEPRACGRTARVHVLRVSYCPLSTAPSCTGVTVC